MEEQRRGGVDGLVQKIVHEFEGGDRMAVMGLVQLCDEVYIERSFRMCTHRRRYSYLYFENRYRHISKIPR
jgi:hypothetical protein